MNKEPVHQAYVLLKIVFVVAPILAGLDKFFNLLVIWSKYLHPMFGAWGETFMMIAGVIEIIAGIGVILKPRIFANIVGIWLALIVVNLVLIGFYDIALRDVGLCLSAFALGRLAKSYA